MIKLIGLSYDMSWSIWDFILLGSIKWCLGLRHHQWGAIQDFPAPTINVVKMPTCSISILTNNWFPFGQKLQHLACSVQCLCLLNNTTITNPIFANDTLLFLDDNHENFDTALTINNRFVQVSGAKLTLHKPIDLWLAYTERSW